MSTYFIHENLSIIHKIKWGNSVLILLIFIAACGLFRLVIFPELLIKFEQMFLSFLLLIFACCYVYKYWNNKILMLKKVVFVFYFILFVLFSFINAKFFNNQDLNLSFRVSYSWLYYSFLYLLIAKRVGFAEIYVACTIFAFIRFALFCYTLMTGDYIFQTEVGADLEGARGVMRIRVPGMMTTYLWGFWSAGKYLKSKNNIYIVFFFISIIQSFLEVSRQHIAVYIVLSLLLFMYKLSIIKKFIFTGLAVSFLLFVLPQIKIYQALVEVTEDQEYATNGFKDDVRIRGMEYYLLEYPQSTYTKIMGNSKYHSESEYGKKINRIISNKGYILSDFGFVGIYIYFGLCGLFFYAFLLYWTIKIPVQSEYSSLKFFIYFLFLTNILSNAFEGSTLILPTVLYILFRNYKNIIYKRLPIKS